MITIEFSGCFDRANHRISEATLSNNDNYIPLLYFILLQLDLPDDLKILEALKCTDQCPIPSGHLPYHAPLQPFIILYLSILTSQIRVNLVLDKLPPSFTFYLFGETAGGTTTVNVDFT